MGSKRLELSPAFDAASVAVSFPPTRSTIASVHPPASVAVSFSKGPGLAFRLTGNFTAATNVQVEVLFGGEPLGDATVAWSTDGTRSISALSEVQLLEYYKERASLARLSEEAMYRVLFDFDRMTNPNLLKLEQEDLSVCVRKKYLETVQTLQQVLLARLKLRFEGGSGPLPDAPDARVIRRCMVLTTWVFRRSLRHLGDSIDGSLASWAVVGEAFSEFAAGAYRDKVTISAAPGSEVKHFPWLVNEPDSAFVFLFTEWALEGAARGPCRQMWLVLLPFFVRMQDFYLSRFDIDEDSNRGMRDRLDRFDTPRRRLGFQHWSRLNLRLPFASTPCYAAERTTFNLRRAARTLGDWTDGRGQTFTTEADGA